MALHHAQTVLGEENCISQLPPLVSPLDNTAPLVWPNQLSLTPGVEYLKSEISTVLSENLDASKGPLS